MGKMFVDVESDGLYGGFLSVAAIVIDENGEETDSFYGVLKNAEKYTTNEWVKNNVLPYLNQTVRGDNDYYDTEKELLETFYSFYQLHADCEVIADTPYPVEMRLFMSIVEADIKNREFKAPYPLMDLSSMIYICGYSPHIERRTMVDCSDLTLHNALDDVRTSIRIWEKLMEEMKNDI